jgi:hypothetical protein
MSASLDKLFFSQQNISRRLLLLRVSLGLIILVLVSLGPYGSFYTETASFLYHPGPLLPFLPPLSAHEFSLLRGLVCSAALLFSLGLWQRLTGPVLALSFFVFNYYISRFAAAQWSYNVHLNLFVALLCCINTRQTPTQKNQERSSLLLSFMQLYIALLYFQTALSKLLHGGLRWFLQGETIYTNALLLGGERGAFFASYPWLPPMLGVGTGLFEFGFLVWYVAGFNRRWLGVAGALFHLGIFVVMGISFWHLWMLYPALFVLDPGPKKQLH